MRIERKLITRMVNACKEIDRGYDRTYKLDVKSAMCRALHDNNAHPKDIGDAVGLDRTTVLYHIRLHDKKMAWDGYEEKYNKCKQIIEQYGD